MKSLSNEISNQVDQIRDHVWKQASDQLSYHVWRQARDNIGVQATDKICSHIKAQVSTHVMETLDAY